MVSFHYQCRSWELPKRPYSSQSPVLLMLRGKVCQPYSKKLKIQLWEEKKNALCIKSDFSLFYPQRQVICPSFNFQLLLKALLLITAAVAVTVCLWVCRSLFAQQAGLFSEMRDFHWYHMDRKLPRRRLYSRVPWPQKGSKRNKLKADCVIRLNKINNCIVSLGTNIWE